MATTTNFGWETPDDTDLVKDGAAAIRTALGGVDTSFVDLKGGTTGQVLSKASNTDLDYTWVTTDDANAIQNAIVDAKGDLIAASAADTPARLAVGTNGQVLTANSAQSTGLEWKTQATYSTYTPTLKQSNTVTFTNQNGGYAEIGNFVHWYGRINITGTGTSANAIYLDGLPVNWASGVNPEYTGIAQFYDASAGLTYYANAFFLSSAYTLYLAGLSTFQGFLGQTGSPFSGAIDTGDVIWWDVTYRKA